MKSLIDLIALLCSYFREHGTKVLGFAQVTLGALAVTTDVFTERQVKWVLVLNGVLVAWRGYFNSQQANKQ